MKHSVKGVQTYNQRMDTDVEISRGNTSNRIVAVDATPPPFTMQNNRDDKQDCPGSQEPGWRKFLAYVGPGFLVSMGYIDPGNLETDLQAGANHQYELLWVVLIGIIFALILQSLAANLGVSSGKHLAELCKVEYPKYVKYGLWLLAELAVVASDIPEVIGTAFALNILFHIPVWSGVLITGLSTLLLLGVQKYGVGKLELIIAILTFIMALCFFGELANVKPPASGVFKGMFVPKLTGQGATEDAIALLGSLIMPHNLFLHSALVLSRKPTNSVHGINNACRYFLMETGFAFFVAFIINVAVISVSGAICSADNLSDENADQCNNINLNSASFLLKNVLGKSSSTLYGIALLASGQSSTITDTYAGQYIMQGFLDLKMKQWSTNLMTRCIAIGPSLIVSFISGSHGAGRLIVLSQIILSFELPFALIPLLKFSTGNNKMGPHKNSIYIMVFAWILGFGIIGVNIYFLSASFIDWLIHNSLSKVLNIITGIVVFPLMTIYLVAVAYLTFRRDIVVTSIDPLTEEPEAQARTERDCEFADNI